ncbi:hypothetical protein LR48_Vigan03g058000 [Vigna angularis]|uniref:Uncharacterized protein n=1 Tax=Phaseolus angularis TaxID=3914 RepID=A0A0L9U462_PHAAN|nr:hypothetical protein LR48_Vigan03g058000 [Vigna angularis]
MTGKAKPKEIAAKIDAATTNSGDGKAGTGLMHHEARHPKIPSEEDKVVNLHAMIASESSKPRPSIRGSHKKCLDFGNEILFAFLT